MIWVKEPVNLRALHGCHTCELCVPLRPLCRAPDPASPAAPLLFGSPNPDRAAAHTSGEARAGIPAHAATTPHGACTAATIKTRWGRPSNRWWARVAKVGHCYYPPIRATRLAESPTTSPPRLGYHGSNSGRKFGRDLFGPSAPQIDPTSVDLLSSARCLSNLANFGRCWSNFGRCRPIFDRPRPNLAGFGSLVADVRSKFWSDFGRTLLHSAEFGPDLVGEPLYFAHSLPLIAHLPHIPSADSHREWQALGSDSIAEATWPLPHHIAEAPPLRRLLRRTPEDGARSITSMKLQSG